MKTTKTRIIFIVSLIISVLVIVISANGLSDSLYQHESQAWKVQCCGQDLVNLALVVPCLMVSALLLLNGHVIGRLTWPGIMLYLIYTFVIYCFDVHFNSFFIEYCLILGLCVYSLIYVMSNRNSEEVGDFPRSTWLIKGIAVYLLLIGIVFYVLWLSEIIPAIRSGAAPRSLTEMRLFTNPVQVLDLSLLLPLFFITPVHLFRKKRLGLDLAAGMLTFSFLMDSTILVLDMLEEDNSAMRTIFICLSLVSMVLLIFLIKNYSSLRETQHDLLWKKPER